MWFTEVENDLEELKITPADVTEWSSMRNKLKKKFTGFEDKPKKKTGAIWTEERKEKHQATMNEIQKQREKRQMQKVEINIVHSGSFEKKKQ